jgi:DNA repair ATPase RecN
VCQRKPGPRCSAHVGQQRDQAVADLIAVDRSMVAALRADPHADLTDQQRDLWRLKGLVERLNDEYDETPAGRAAIKANLAGLTPEEVQETGLAPRLAAAEERYARKCAALKAADEQRAVTGPGPSTAPPR